MSEIADKVKDIIKKKLAVDDAEIVETATFNDLGADSLDQVELIMEFENEFGMTIPEEEAGQITTVGGAIEYIEQHK